MKLGTDQPEVNVLYRALDQFRDTCLRDLRSAFLDPSDPAVADVWTPATAAELVEKFIERPDESKRTFMEKLTDQLSDASPASDPTPRGTDLAPPRDLKQAALRVEAQAPRRDRRHQGRDRPIRHLRRGSPSRYRVDRDLVLHPPPQSTVAACQIRLELDFGD